MALLTQDVKIVRNQARRGLLVLAELHIPLKFVPKKLNDRPNIIGCRTVNRVPYVYAKRPNCQVNQITTEVSMQTNLFWYSSPKSGSIM